MVNTQFKRCFTLGALLLVSALTGCATTGGGGELPDWVLSPPADSATTIYGVGEGRALRTARDDALAVIAGKLETRVTSDVETKTVLTNGREHSTTRNSVRTTTEALKLSEFQIVNSAEAANRLFVLLSVDRSALVTSILEDLKRLDGEIDARLSDPGNTSKLKRLYRLTLARDIISEAMSKVLLAQQVSQDSTLKAHDLGRYRQLVEERERMQQSLTLAVSWDRTTPGIGEKLLTMLLELGLHAEASGPGRVYDGVVVVSGQSTRQEIFNEYHVQLGAMVTLKDSNGSEISAAHYKAAASSLRDYGAAEKIVNRQIANEIHERGIWRALNMHK